MNPSFIYRNITLLYRSLDEIQKNIGFISRRGNALGDNRRNHSNAADRNYVINNDQRYMIEMYKEIYNTILQHIEFLYSQILHTSTMPPPSPHPSRNPSNLFYFNGRYYTIDHVEPATPSANTAAQGTTNIAEPRPRILIPQQVYEPVRRRNLPVLSTRYNGNFNDPVYIVATAQQLDTATRNVLYGEIDSPINSSCPICLDIFTPNSEVTQIHHCGHIFNRTELARWFQRNVRCPVCRYDIRDYVAQPTTAVGQPNLNTNNAATSTTSASTTASTTPLATSPSASTNVLPSSISDDQLSIMLDNIANEALHNIFHNTNNTTASQIFTNLFSNNVENLTYDPSSNSIMFDTFIQHP